MKKSAGTIMLMQLLSVAGGLGLMVLLLFQGNGISSMFYHLYNTVTLLLLLAVAVPPMLLQGVWKDLFRVFQFGKNNQKFSICEIRKTLLAIELLQRQIIYGTIMIVCVQTLYILMQVDALEELGPNLAVDLDSIIYMAIALLFIEPLKSFTQRYLENYLAEEED